MITETITWYEITERLPGDDRTVLVDDPVFAHIPECNGTVWLGYYEDETWFSVEGVEIEGVERWAEKPRGGLA